MNDIQELQRHPNGLQNYKERNLKKKLTMSDLQLVSKFAENTTSLKQIDEEVED